MHPVCDPRAALPFVVGVRYAMRVYPGFYLPFGIRDRTVYVFGPGDGSAVVGKEDLTAGVRVVNAYAVIDGLDANVNALTGVICDGSNLRLARATLRGDYQGVVATNCDIGLEEVRVIGSFRAGLTIKGRGRYRILNSYFQGGDLQGVIFDGASSGTFAFNTVRSSGEVHPGGIDCGAVPRSIRDSIVVDNFAGPSGAQTVGACVHERVVVGTGDLRLDPGLIRLDPDLDLLGRLLDTAANFACCVDRAPRYVSSLYRDFFGTARPQGASNDIGAHELVYGASM